MAISLLHYNNNTPEIADTKMISGYCIDESQLTSEELSLATQGELYPYTIVYQDSTCQSLVQDGILNPSAFQNNDIACGHYWSRVLNPKNSSNCTICTNCPTECNDKVLFCDIETNKKCCCCSGYNQSTAALWLLGDCNVIIDEVPTTRSMHWLNGGYFYADKNLRNYIYDESGTIHFSTNVKYDTIDNTSQERQDFIPIFDIGYGNGYLTLESTVSANLLASRMFRMNPVANSLGYNYSIFRTQGLKPAKTLVSSIRYNNVTKSFDSKFNVYDTGLYNCGYEMCVGLESYETHDSDNIMVMLSTGNITHFPLTNELVNYTQRTVSSFTMMEYLYRTYYYDFVTPVLNVYDETNNLIKCDVSLGSYNAYYINNSFNIPYTMVTTALSVTDGTNTYGNWKWRVTIIKDPNSDEFYLNMDDGSSTSLMYNEFNEGIGDEDAYILLDRILTYMKTNYPDLNIHLTLYEDESGSYAGTTKLTKTTNILEPGTLYTSHIIESDPYDDRPNQKRLRINLSKPIKNLVYAGYKDTYKYTSGVFGNSTRGTYILMVKVSSLIKGYRNNTIDNKSSYIENVNNTATFEGTEVISVLSEQTLFNDTSSKFSTPDYTSISHSVSNITIPLRGSEYTNTERSNYPKIRYVRKSNGKFYIQILAGAFPYYHSVLHYPAIKELEECTPAMNDAGECIGRSVVNSLEKICSKSADWYNHVASTKWICYVKHTQFGDDPTSYIETESTKQVIKGPNQKIYGSGKNKNPGTGGGSGQYQGSAGEVAANPNTNPSAGGGFTNPFGSNPQGFGGIGQQEGNITEAL